MKTNLTVTIGREFCSGGALIARRVAELLEIPLYDKEIIDGAVKITDLPEKTVTAHDEQPLGYFSVGGYQYGFNWYTDDPSLLLPMGMRVAEAQFDVMRKATAEGPCVVVGRCADYVLEDCENKLNVFIKADLSHRISTACRRYDISREEAKRLIRKTDRIRSSYYHYYTQQVWGASENYDLIIDTSKVDAETAAAMIVLAAKCGE